MPFAKFSVIAIASVAGLCLLHLILFGAKRSPARSPGERIKRYSILERLLTFVTAISLLDLALSGFGGVIFTNGMHGYQLWFHMGAAGVFTVALAFMMLRWAEEHRFNKTDWQWFKQGGGYLTRSNRQCPAGKYDGAQKALFWLTGALGFGCLLTMLLGMLPWFGTHGIETLIRLHRFGGLALVLVTIVNVYLSLTRTGYVRSLFAGTVDSETARFYHSQWVDGLQDEVSEHEIV